MTTLGPLIKMDLGWGWPNFNCAKSPSSSRIKETFCVHGTFVANSSYEKVIASSGRIYIFIYVIKGSSNSSVLNDIIIMYTIYIYHMVIPSMYVHPEILLMYTSSVWIVYKI